MLKAPNLEANTCFLLRPWVASSVQDGSSKMSQFLVLFHVLFKHFI